jgi:hypothetical protein
MAATLIQLKPARLYSRRKRLRSIGIWFGGVAVLKRRGRGRPDH